MLQNGFSDPYAIAERVFKTALIEAIRLGMEFRKTDTCGNLFIGNAKHSFTGAVYIENGVGA